MLFKMRADISKSALEKMQLRNMYRWEGAENTGRDYETVCADTERDKWKSAEEACEYGLIDKVITFHDVNK